MSRTEHKSDALLLIVDTSPGQATIRWKGVSDARYPGQFLSPIIRELGQNLRSSQVTVDLSEMEFMNSSTVMQVVSLIRLLDANGPPVRVVFSSVAWQRTHYNCTSVLARTLKHTRVELMSAPTLHAAGAKRV